MHIIVCPVLKVQTKDDYQSKNGRNQQVKMRNFVLSYLRYRESNQIKSYTNYNGIKGSSD